MGFFSKLFGSSTPDPKKRRPHIDPETLPGLEFDELARRLGVPLDQLRATPIAYKEIRIPKRDGTIRTLQAPDEPLKKLQRTILHRLLRKLSAHPAATGFERGQSIATNAAPHVGADVILKLDIRDFFTATREFYVASYFRTIGWSGKVAAFLTKLTTHKGGLPQGAPTSPRLSNLLNYELDQRLFTLALQVGAIYTRYADDMTFSFRDGSQGLLRVQNPKTLQAEQQPAESYPLRTRVAQAMQFTQRVVGFYEYELHTKKKLRIASRGNRMLITGLVVNDKLNLPRTTRRRLRAVEHHLATGKPATLTPIQLQGWKALQLMIAAHQSPANPPPADPPASA